MKTSTRNGTTSSVLTRAQLVSKRLARASCATCVYLQNASSDAAYAGECHRGAPHPFIVQLAAEVGGVSVAGRAEWPLVRRADRCGEYQPRPQVR